MNSDEPSGPPSPSPCREVIRPLPTGPSVDVLLQQQWRRSVESITRVDLSALKRDTRVNTMIAKHVPGSLLAKVSKAIDEMMTKSFQRATEITMASPNRPRVDYPGQYREYDSAGEGQRTIPLNQPITVADVCELAKAGVKMDVGDVARLLTAPVVYQNPPSTPQTQPFSMSLEERIEHRWQSTQIMSVERSYDTPTRVFANRSPEGFLSMPFKIGKVITHGEKQYVFVHKPGNPPLVIEDDVSLFPSDTLMNSLRLMDKALPDAPSGNMSGGVAGGGMSGTSTPSTGNAINQRYQAAQNAAQNAAQKAVLKA